MKFIHLTGKRAYGGASPKDYTDWAEALLCDGVESENIAVLAGLGLEKYPDSEDVEFYFQKSIKDLGLQLPEEYKALKNYSKYICEQIINNEIKVSLGVSLLEGFYQRTDYTAIYSIWDEVNDDLWCIKHGEQPYITSSLTKENIEDYVKNVAQQFITLNNIELPSNFFHLSFCSKCKHIGENKLVRFGVLSWLPEKLYRVIFNRFPIQKPICSKCSCEFPFNMSNYEAREQYLLKNLTNRAN